MKVYKVTSFFQAAVLFQRLNVSYQSLHKQRPFSSNACNSSLVSHFNPLVLNEISSFIVEGIVIRIIVAGDCESFRRLLTARIVSNVHPQ